MSRFRLECAAFVVVALLGVLLVQPGVASAIEPTALCSEAESGCSEANLYPDGTELTGTSFDFEVKSELGTFACETSALEGTTEADYGYSLPIGISSLSFSGCELAGSVSCTVEALNLPYTGWLEEAGTESSFDIEEDTGRVSLEMNCGVVVCEYAAEEPVLSVTSGGTLQLVASEVRLEALTPICGEEALLSGNYTVKTASGANVLPVEMLVPRVKLLPKKPPAQGKPLEIELGKTEEVTVKNETVKADFAILANGTEGNFQVKPTTCGAELKAGAACDDTVGPLAGAKKKDEGRLVLGFGRVGIVPFTVSYRLRAK